MQHPPRPVTIAYVMCLVAGLFLLANCDSVPDRDFRTECVGDGKRLYLTYRTEEYPMTVTVVDDPGCVLVEGQR